MLVKTTPLARRHAAGFTLVELLVTMLIVTVGILGIVKMQAAGVAESQVSRVRSLMTFQAESLASSMRANRGYWASTTAAFSTAWTTVATSQTYPMSGSTPDCTANACSATDMAHADMAAWRDAFVNAFPGATATVTCSGACTAGATTTPRSYDIALSWSEKTVAVNRSGNSTSTSPVSMVLHVQP